MFFRFFLFVLLIPACALAQTPREKQLFDFINAERKRLQLNLLEWEPQIYQVAVGHSRDMAITGNVSHQGSDGSYAHERIEQSGAYASRTAENISRDSNVVSAHTMLMLSLGHRDNILDPGFTHAAVGVVENEKRLYITELFIRKIPDYPLETARQKLLGFFNNYREQHRLQPLIFSEALSNVAQSQVDTQEKLESLTPALTTGLLTHYMTVRYNVYTTPDLDILPRELRADLEAKNFRAGIGVKKIRGKLCSTGCFLIVAILAS